MLRQLMIFLVCSLIACTLMIIVFALVREWYDPFSVIPNDAVDGPPSYLIGVDIYVDYIVRSAIDDIDTTTMSINILVSTAPSGSLVAVITGDSNLDGIYMVTEERILIYIDTLREHAKYKCVFK